MGCHLNDCKTDPRSNYYIYFLNGHDEFVVKVTRSICWYGWKGLGTKYAHVKYESPMSNGFKVIGNVKVCATDRHTCTNKLYLKDLKQCRDRFTNIICGVYHLLEVSL